MGVKVCAIQGVDPFWDLERGYNSGKFGHLKKYSSQKAMA